MQVEGADVPRGWVAADLDPGNVLVDLPTPNVDTGNGLERTACVLQDVGNDTSPNSSASAASW